MKPSSSDQRHPRGSGKEPARRVQDPERVGCPALARPRPPGGVQAQSAASPPAGRSPPYPCSQPSSVRARPHAVPTPISRASGDAACARSCGRSAARGWRETGAARIRVLARCGKSKAASFLAGLSSAEPRSRVDMSVSLRSPAFPRLPRSWPGAGQSAVVRTMALAHFVFTRGSRAGVPTAASLLLLARTSRTHASFTGSASLETTCNHMCRCFDNRACWIARSAFRRHAAGADGRLPRTILLHRRGRRCLRRPRHR